MSMIYSLSVLGKTHTLSLVSFSLSLLAFTLSPLCLLTFILSPLFHSFPSLSLSLHPSLSSLSPRFHSLLSLDLALSLSLVYCQVRQVQGTNSCSNQPS